MLTDARLESANKAAILILVCFGTLPKRVLLEINVKLKIIHLSKLIDIFFE